MNIELVAIISRLFGSAFPVSAYDDVERGKEQAQCLVKTSHTCL